MFCNFNFFISFFSDPDTKHRAFLTRDSVRAYLEIVDYNKSNFYWYLERQLYQTILMKIKQHITRRRIVSFHLRLNCKNNVLV